MVFSNPGCVPVQRDLPNGSGKESSGAAPAALVKALIHLAREERRFFNGIGFDFSAVFGFHVLSIWNYCISGKIYHLIPYGRRRHNEALGFPPGNYTIFPGIFKI
jgi:hypothetical protein